MIFIKRFDGHCPARLSSLWVFIAVVFSSVRHMTRCVLICVRYSTCLQAYWAQMRIYKRFRFQERILWEDTKLISIRISFFWNILHSSFCRCRLLLVLRVLHSLFVALQITSTLTFPFLSSCMHEAVLYNRPRFHFAAETLLVILLHVCLMWQWIQHMWFVFMSEKMMFLWHLVACGFVDLSK